MQSVKNRRFLHLLGWISGVLMVVPLLGHAYIGTLSRYLADDYCTTGTLRELGFFGSQLRWYLTWSGRFSFTFMVNLIEVIGPWIVPFLTALVLLIWLAGLTQLIRRLPGPLGGSGARRSAMLLGMVVLLGTLDGTPDVYQSLYWMTGMVTYSLPLVLVAFYAAWLIKRVNWKNSLWIVLLSGLFAFSMGGFSETYVTTQTTILAVIVVIILPQRKDPNRGRKLALIGSGLVGSLLALVVIVAAPGNQMRIALMPEQADFVSIVVQSVYDTYLFIRITISDSWQTLALVVLLPLTLTAFADAETSNAPGRAQSFRRSLLRLSMIGITASLAMVASVFPSEYATANYPAERALITTGYIMTLALAFGGAEIGFALSQSIRQFSRLRILQITASILLLSLVGFNVFASLAYRQAQYPRASKFAASWDDRDHEIRKAVSRGEEDIAVRSLPHMAGLAEVEADPDAWINRCISQSYGLRSVVAK